MDTNHSDHLDHADHSEKQSAFAPPTQKTPGVPRVVIVGGGFGGLYAARTLAHSAVHITLIDKTNHHVFQPLLYQVATASLSPEQITAPLRSVLRNNRNVEVLMGEVHGVDTKQQLVYMEHLTLPYDYLILAMGSRHSYFGHPEWEQFAPGLKAITDATTVRRNILLAFEAAEIEQDDEKRKALMTFVLVGGGPTGVEMSGQIAEIAHRALSSDFRHINPSWARVLLVEAGPRLLAGFHESLATKSQQYLERMGIEVRTNARVENVDAHSVTINGEYIRCGSILWAAGNAASPAGKWVGADWVDVELTKSGQAKVTPRLTVKGLDNVFIIGDTAYLEQDGKPLPGVAQAAIQMGKYVAKVIHNQVAHKPAPPPFRYFDKGNMATVGRKFAIYDLNELRTPAGKRLTGPIRFAGFFAWLMWLGIHVIYLIGFGNRFFVLMNWLTSYLTFARGARLITPDAGSHIARPLEALSESSGQSTTPSLHESVPEKSDLQRELLKVNT